MKIKLPYGKSYQSVDIEDKRISAILETKASEYKLDESEQSIVARAVKNPIGSPGLDELAADAKNVLFITSDHTRPVPSRITMPIILQMIKDANPEAHVKILVATGCHRATSRQEMVEKFGQDIVDQYEIINHFGYDHETMVYKGQLPSGGELWLNRLADWADLILAEGLIEPHFFAGFSGGRKSILPGIASSKTVLYNHCAEFIDSPYAKTGNLDRNPIHEDMVFAAKKAKLRFIINVVINEEKMVIRAFAGDPVKAHEAGCNFVKELVQVDAVKADIVMTTNAGYPLDQNIYQAVKGMTAAEACVNDGGVVIIAASCIDGHGGEAFYRWFADSSSPKEIGRQISAIAASETRPDQWQVQILARVLKKCKVIMVAEESQATNIKNMHMLYAKTVEEALRIADGIAGQDAKIVVIPDGVNIIIN